MSAVRSSTFPSDINDLDDDNETQTVCFHKWLQNQTQGIHAESDAGGARESNDLLVDFGETPRPMRTSTSLSRSMPFICRTSPDITGSKM